MHSQPLDAPRRLINLSHPSFFYAFASLVSLSLSLSLLSSISVRPIRTIVLVSRPRRRSRPRVDLHIHIDRSTIYRLIPYSSISEHLLARDRRFRAMAFKSRVLIVHGFRSAESCSQVPDLRRYLFRIVGQPLWGLFSC